MSLPELLPIACNSIAISVHQDIVQVTQTLQAIKMRRDMIAEIRAVTGPVPRGLSAYLAVILSGALADLERARKIFERSAMQMRYWHRLLEQLFNAGCPLAPTIFTALADYEDVSSELFRFMGWI